MSTADQEKTFGARVRAFRKGIGLTQVDLAQRSGFSSGAISQIESGDYVPKGDRWPALAHALGVTVAELAAGDADPAVLREFLSSAAEESMEYTRERGPIVSHDDSPSGRVDWEWMARKLFDMMEQDKANEKLRIEKAAETQKYIMDKTTETEQLRIREVEAVHAQSLRNVIEELKSTHHVGRRSDEGSAQGAP